MSWKVLQDKPAPGGSMQKPNLVVRGSSGCISKALFDAMEQPRFVAVAYDAERRVLGLIPRSDGLAVKRTAGGIRISCGRVFSRIQAGEGTRFFLQGKEEVAGETVFVLEEKP